MNRSGQPQPPSRPQALAPPPSIPGFPRGGSPYQYIPPRPMQQVTQQQQQQQFGQPPQQQPRTPSGATPGGQSPGFPTIPGGGGAPSRGGASFPFGAGGTTGGQQQANLQQLQQGLQNQLNNLSLNPQQQTSSSSMTNGPPSTTPSHQSLFSHQSDAQSINNGSSAPSGAGLDPLDFPALSSLGTASQALPPPPTPNSYASQASNPALLAQSLQQGGAGSRGDFNSDDFPALGGDLNGQGGNVMTNGAGALGNGTAMGVVGGGGKFARGVSEDPRNPNYATKLAAAQSASSSAWPSQQHPSNSSSSAPPLAPPPSSTLQSNQQLPSLSSSQQQQQQSIPQSRQQSYPPNLTNGSVPLQQPPPNLSSNGAGGGPYLDHQAVGGAGVGPDGGSSGDGRGAGVGGGSLPSQTIPAQQILSSPADKWGLQAFLHAIRNADEDKGMLSFGTDLMSLGMDMGSNDPLSSSLVAPWAEPSQTKNVHLEEEYHTPACYNVRPAAAQGKMNLFAEETLFFIFYASPRDVLQEVAAQELYARHWRWHKEMGYWLTKDPRAEATEKTATYEKGTYIFFDPNSWSRVDQKDFNLVYDALEDRSQPQQPQPQQQQQQLSAQQQQQLVQQQQAMAAQQQMGQGGQVGTPTGGVRSFGGGGQM